MDLRECSDIHGARHPWETARLKALRRILASELRDGISVLDEGCGDGFLVRNLTSPLRAQRIAAVDVNLSPEQLDSLHRLPGRIEYLASNPQGEFDLVLLLDVLEHVEDDASFLGALAGNSLAGGGKVVITVPAFQSLYSSHDSFLGHHRRYTLRQLEEVARLAGLAVQASGYLFCSLLLPKLLLFKLPRRPVVDQGIGSWRFGRVVTSLVERVLNLDNALLLAAAQLGVKVPGLSAWALCVKGGAGDGCATGRREGGAR